MSGFPITESVDSLHRNDPNFEIEDEAEDTEEQDYIESLIRTEPTDDEDN